MAPEELRELMKNCKAEKLVEEFENMEILENNDRVAEGDLRFEKKDGIWTCWESFLEYYDYYLTKEIDRL